MATDWVATLQEQADLVLEVWSEVEKALDASDLTLEQASRLYRMVEKAAQNFDGIVESLKEHDLEDGFVETVETIEDSWTDLSVVTANSLRSLRGLELIDIAPKIAGPAQLHRSRR